MTDPAPINDEPAKGEEQTEEDPDLDVRMDPAPPEQQTAEHAEAEDNLLEAREPTKKDISLREFMSKMDDYAPIVSGQPLFARTTIAVHHSYIPKLQTGLTLVAQIPDAVTSHHLLLAGLDPSTTPLPLTRLLALATQKFIADVAADAYQYSRMRSSTSAAAAAAAGPGPGGLGETAGQTGNVGGGGAGGGSGAAGRGKDDKGRAAAHVIGVQRPGYGGGGSGAAGGQGGRAVLTMEDLGCAVGEYGVNVKRGEFYR